MERRWWIQVITASLVVRQELQQRENIRANRRFSAYKNPSLEARDGIDTCDNSGFVPWDNIVETTHGHARLSLSIRSATSARGWYTRSMRKREEHHIFSRPWVILERDCG